MSLQKYIQNTHTKAYKEHVQTNSREWRKLKIKEYMECKGIQQHTHTKESNGIQRKSKKPEGIWRNLIIYECKGL